MPRDITRMKLCFNVEGHWVSAETKRSGTVYSTQWQDGGLEIGRPVIPVLHFEQS